MPVNGVKCDRFVTNHSIYSVVLGTIYLILCFTSIILKSSKECKMVYKIWAHSSAAQEPQLGSSARRVAAPARSICYCRKLMSGTKFECTSKEGDKDEEPGGAGGKVECSECNCVQRSA